MKKLLVLILVVFMATACGGGSIGHVGKKLPENTFMLKIDPTQPGHHRAHFNKAVLEYDYTVDKQSGKIHFDGEINFIRGKMQHTDLGGELFLVAHFINDERVILKEKLVYLANFQNSFEPLPFEFTVEYDDAYSYIRCSMKGKYYY